jgi:uncharacterized protein YjbI with pentapeptide repeats
MDLPLNYESTYDQVDFTKEKLPLGRYEYCTFKTCILTNHDLSNYEFIECEFTDCDLSNCKPGHTAFRDVQFTACKLIGINFEYVNPFLISMKFKGCTLDFSSFPGMVLKKIKFEKCSLMEVDFTNADLTGISFDHCNLTKTIFENTKLEKADFRTAKNFIIDPEVNSLRKARFSSDGLAGLLAKYKIVID